MSLLSLKKRSKITSTFVSVYALGLLVLALSYSFFADSNIYKISPELSLPQPKPAGNSSGEISSKVENGESINATEIKLQLNDLEFLNQGKEVYQTHCAVCHGIDLEGQQGWNKVDGKNNILAPPHDETGHTWDHSDKELFFLTKYGGSGKAGGISAMPGYEKILSDKEIISVLSFIKSTWPIDIRLRHDQINEQAFKR